MAKNYLCFFALSIFFLNVNFSLASSECDGYLICQNFETDPIEGPAMVFLLDNKEKWSWSCDSRSVLNDTSWPLRGNSSLKCYACRYAGCAVYSPIINPPNGLSEMWVHFRAYFAGPTADWAIAIKNPLGHNQVLVRPYQGSQSNNPIYLAINDNATYNFNPGIVYEEFEFQLNTTYHFWIRVKSATSTTSNDGEAEVYISKNGTRPSTPIACVTNVVSSADGLLEYGQIAFGAAYGYAPNLVSGIYYYDQIYVSATEIADVDSRCNDSDGDGYDYCVTNGYNPCIGAASLNCDDNCPKIPNPAQADTDGDGLGNSCDNCPNAYNPHQEDADADGHGNVCDNCTDNDNDGYGNPGYSANTCPADNCANTPNGQTQGTCVKEVGGVLIGTGVTCTPGGTECATGQTCQLEQADMNSNGIGDACECYADFNHDGKVNTSDLGIMKTEFFRTNCATVPCQADINGDGSVNTTDLGIMKVQFFKTGYPVP